MSSYKGSDYWYEWLEEQSRTDHIYDLIHNYLRSDFYPEHNDDFVGLTQVDMPESLQPIPEAHLSSSNDQKKLDHRGEPVILLNNNFLKDYLEAARQMATTEDEQDNNYIVLLFTQPVYPDDDDDDDDYENRDMEWKDYELPSFDSSEPV